MSSNKSKRILSSKPQPTAIAVRYALGALAAVCALLLRNVLDPFFGEDNAYHTAWLAVVFAAWYCGIGPAIVSVVICSVGIWYWFVPPFHSFANKGDIGLSGLLGFLILSAVIIAFGESTRRNILNRERAEEDLRKAREELEQRVHERTAALKQRTAEDIEKATLLDLANDAIFMKTANGNIAYWNSGAERLYGWKANEVIGKFASGLLQTQSSIPLAEVEKREFWEGELLHTTRDGRQITVASRWTLLLDENKRPAGWMEINTDITARKSAEDAARRLSGRILTLQDDERRRIARELHDSLGQYLAALKMQLDILAQSVDKQPDLIAECTHIVEQCLKETRTISHLLHPPLLDEAGFASAARWYVDGFAQRSGIDVDLVLPRVFGRLRRDVEIALFRVLQEALTNVHRHSGSTRVEIRVSVEEQRVQMKIQDFGQGIPTGTLRQLLDGGAKTSVGVAGMRERARELGGSLQIASDAKGTLLTLTLPLKDSEEKPLLWTGQMTAD
jgi:PAS domain S-box-containing protein